MTDSLREVETEIRDDAGDDETAPLREFVRALRTESDDSLRLVVRYRGDEHEVLYARADVEERFGDDELDERAKALVLRAIGDPPREPELDDLGSLEATLRWYDSSLVATFPYREWSGVVAVFDRSSSALVDAALDNLYDE